MRFLWAFHFYPLRAHQRQTANLRMQIRDQPLARGNGRQRIAVCRSRPTGFSRSARHHLPAGQVQRVPHEKKALLYGGPSFSEGRTRTCDLRVMSRLDNFHLNVYYMDFFGL
ncbi:MAG: hypothetical protein LBK44_04510 [Spirochaetales bacterium]|nr:hypothetical protein [Spirochaetales bacterium]